MEQRGNPPGPIVRHCKSTQSDSSGNDSADVPAFVEQAVEYSSVTWISQLCDQLRVAANAKWNAHSEKDASDKKHGDVDRGCLDDDAYQKYCRPNRNAVVSAIAISYGTTGSAMTAPILNAALMSPRRAPFGLSKSAKHEG